MAAWKVVFALKSTRYCHEIDAMTQAMEEELSANGVHGVLAGKALQAVADLDTESSRDALRVLQRYVSFGEMRPDQKKMVEKILYLLQLKYFLFK